MQEDKKYVKALEIAKANMEAVKERGEAAMGSDALAFIDSLLTPEEIAESDLKVALIGEIIKARKEKGLSQKNLEALTGIKQPVIARLEKGITNPQLGTIIKLLAPLGKKLAIVTLE